MPLTSNAAPFTRILSWDEAVAARRHYRQAGKIVVTTNGCFDLLHPGHVHFLEQAQALGDVLIVGLNGDGSVRRLKGRGRPLLPVGQRATLLAALKAVDHVVVFEELMPLALLERLQPDIHCKAADYTLDDLPETEVVRRFGGEIRILPLDPGYSTSQTLERIVSAATGGSEAPAPALEPSDLQTYVFDQLLQGGNTLRQTAYRLSADVLAVAGRLAELLDAGGKILLCGNGGSAAHAQQVASQLVMCCRRQRQALAAIALTTDSSILTVVGNDAGFEYIFARQVAALGRPGDALIAISASGHSPNVLRAVEMATRVGMYTIGLTGETASPLIEAVDVFLAAPSSLTLHIQQAHIAMLNVICELIEMTVSGERDR